MAVEVAGRVVVKVVVVAVVVRNYVREILDISQLF